MGSSPTEGVRFAQWAIRLLVLSTINQSRLERPGARVIIIQVDALALVRLVQVPHVPVEVHCAHSLHSVFHIKMVSLLKQNRCMVHKHSIQNGIKTDLVLNHLRSNLMRQVVVNRISHVVRLEVVLKTLLVDHVILEGFHHDVEGAVVLVGVETNSEDSLLA